MATDDSGLYYMCARYYNPEIRRFINQDILTGTIENSQSLNRYAYCQGNPVNYMDPFGLEPCNFFSGLGHSVLNLLGLIPGVGDVFDITNASWYIAEGRWDKAFEAGIAALPFFGNFMPDTGLFRYLKRGLNIASYGGTGFLAGQGMWEGGQALWEEINSKDCSGWRIAGNIVGIGLNGVSLFLSGKGLFSETKALNKILKEDGIYDKLKLDNGGYVNLEFFFGSSKRNSYSIDANKQELFNALKNAPIEYRKNPKTGIMEPYMKQVQITDDYNVILRRDVGDFNHGDLDHWNLEIQTVQGGNIKYNLHLYLGDDGNLLPFTEDNIYIPKKSPFN